MGIAVTAINATVAANWLYVSDGVGAVPLTQQTTVTGSAYTTGIQFGTPLDTLLDVPESSTTLLVGIGLLGLLGRHRRKL